MNAPNESDTQAATIQRLVDRIEHLEVYLTIHENKIADLKKRKWAAPKPPGPPHPIAQYVCIFAEGNLELTERVRHYTKLGWQPHGSPAFIEDGMIQAVVAYSPTTKHPAVPRPSTDRW